MLLIKQEVKQCNRNKTVPTAEHALLKVNSFAQPAELVLEKILPMPLLSVLVVAL
jgi:hypothetical protein